MAGIALVSNKSESLDPLADYFANKTGISVVGVFNSPVCLLASMGIVPKNCIVVMVENEYTFSPRLWAMLRLLAPPLKHIVLLRNWTYKKLEFLLGMGVTGLVHIDAPASRIRHAVQKAARGEMDLDTPFLHLLKVELMERPNPFVVELKDLKINMESKHVFIKGARVELSKLEYRLLEHLAINQGKAISKRELFTEVWKLPDPASGTEDQLWSCIKRLRRKIEPDPQKPIYLTAVVGHHSYGLGLGNLKRGE